MNDSTQVAAALADANRVRKLRKQLRSELKSMPVPQATAMLADAIESCPDWLQNIDVRDLVTWCPKVGVTAQEGLMVRIGVRRKPRLRDLSERQRVLLGVLLRDGLWGQVEQSKGLAA